MWILILICSADLDNFLKLSELQLLTNKVKSTERDVVASVTDMAGAHCGMSPTECGWNLGSRKMGKCTGRKMGKDTELCNARGLRPLGKDSCAM